MSSFVSQSRKSSAMVVTSDVSHVPMWPYKVSAAAGSARQAATAVLMFASVT